MPILITCPCCKKTVACRPIEIVAMKRGRHMKTRPRPSGRAEIIEHGGCLGGGLAIDMEQS